MTREDPDPNWGGARDGAGRPTELDEVLSVQVNVKLTESLTTQLDAQRMDGESRAKCARRLLMERLAQLEG